MTAPIRPSHPALSKLLSAFLELAGRQRLMPPQAPEINLDDLTARRDLFGHRVGQTEAFHPALAAQLGQVMEQGVRARGAVPADLGAGPAMPAEYMGPRFGMDTAPSSGPGGTVNGIPRSMMYAGQDGAPLPGGTSRDMVDWTNEALHPDYARLAELDQTDPLVAGHKRVYQAENHQSEELRRRRLRLGYHDASAEGQPGADRFMNWLFSLGSADHFPLTRK